MHSEPGEVAISGWRCEKCSKAASFGEASIGRAVRCRTHKHHNDVDLKNKRCRHQGCTKHPGGLHDFGQLDLEICNPESFFPCCAAFGNYEELGGRPQYCSAHKMPHHYNVKNRMCESARHLHFSISSFLSLSGTVPPLQHRGAGWLPNAVLGAIL